MTTTEDRFWSKVNKGPDCWEWTASKNGKGYGQFYFEGSPQRAHRLAWELTYGSIPEGMHVLHHCDVTSCVRPDHLFLGTNDENMADRDAKDRVAHGENHCCAKICDLDAWLIKNIEGQSQRAIADWFGVSPHIVSDIRTGKTWRHV